MGPGPLLLKYESLSSKSLLFPFLFVIWDFESFEELLLVSTFLKVSTFETFVGWNLYTGTGIGDDEEIGDSSMFLETTIV